MSLVDGWQKAKYWLLLPKLNFFGEIESHSKDMLVPNFLIDATAVEMSHRTLMRIDFKSFVNFNSNALVWPFFSNVQEHPPFDLYYIISLKNKRMYLF